MAGLKEKLAISPAVLEEINAFLTASANEIIDPVLAVVAKYGTIEEINAKARQSGNLENQLRRLEEMQSPYLADLKWLINQRDQKAFVSMADYRRKVLGDQVSSFPFDKEAWAVTLEISAAQYFEFLIAQAKKAIANQDLMPGRYIRVRNMKEQENNQGELIAFAAAMNIIGASFVETLDTKGTDGSQYPSRRPGRLLLGISVALGNRMTMP